MKIISKNIKEGYVNLIINNDEDIWYLSQIVSKGDIVSGKATRKIKVGHNQDKTTKRTFNANIIAEDIDYGVSSLKINGKINQEVEGAPLGSYQSITLNLGDNLKIIKESWRKLDLEKLEEAQKEHFDFLISVIDRDEATIAILKKQGYNVLLNLKGERKGKQFEGEIKEFFKEVIDKVKQYAERYKCKKLIIGCSPFWKNDIDRHLGDFKSKTFFVLYANSGSEGDIESLLHQKALSSIIEEDRTREEISLVEDALVRISKMDKVSYGLKEVKQLSSIGAVETVLISEKLLKDAQIRGDFGEIDTLMKNVENTSGKIYIIKYNHESGKKLFALGGVIGVLRYNA